jgi:hypothetical protein
VQQHAGQRPPLPPLAMHSPLAPLRRQSCPCKAFFTQV